MREGAATGTGLCYLKLKRENVTPNVTDYVSGSKYCRLPEWLKSTGTTYIHSSRNLSKESARITFLCFFLNQELKAKVVKVLQYILFLTTLEYYIMSKFHISCLKLNELEHFLDLASEPYQMGSTALRPIPQPCACPRTRERVILHRVGPNQHAQAKK